jgi:MFS family permease
MMAIIAGAVITNIYCTQPILPLIKAGFGVDLTTVDLVAAAALLGFATGLALLLPLGDRFDRRKLVLGQIAFACVFAIAAAISPSIDVDRGFLWAGHCQLRATATRTVRGRHVVASPARA